MSITQEIKIDNPATKNFLEMIIEINNKVMEVGRKLIGELIKQKDEEIKEGRDKER